MRKPAGALVAIALLVTAGLSGCATPGPSHLYSVAPGTGAIHDQVVAGTDIARDVPNFVGPGETVMGFAYDPFTDHFFLRLSPGNRLRVVDRPDRSIKREFTMADVPSNGGGDLAVSPRDGHLFLVDPSGPRLFELTRLGKPVRTLPLADGAGPALAVAYDMDRGELLVLAGDGRTLDRYTRSGARLGTLSLERRVRPSLGCDAAFLFAPLAEADEGVGVFDRAGRLVRTLPLRDGDAHVDAGPHSFFRMF